MHPVINRLNRQILALGSQLCVGLDPQPERIPHFFGAGLVGIERFLQEIISICLPYAVAFKPNISFFEALGIEGLYVLERLRYLVPDTHVWLIDGKRGDIGNTAVAQARFLFDELGADATTVSPYMGRDSVAPFLAYHDRLTYVLALTSNAGSQQFQRQICGASGEPLWKEVIREVKTWSNAVGFVVGGTHADTTEAVHLAQSPVLIPGIGVQGGGYSECLIVGASSPVLLSVSRAILYPSQGMDMESERFRLTVEERIQAVLLS